MQDFITLLKNSYYGVEVPYAGEYTAYVREDENECGYYISYCKGMMPPHATDHADTAEEAASKVAESADLSRARESEPDQE